MTDLAPGWNIAAEETGNGGGTVKFTDGAVATEVAVEWTKPIGTANKPDSAKFAYPTGVLS